MLFRETRAAIAFEKCVYDLKCNENISTKVIEKFYKKFSIFYKDVNTFIENIEDVKDKKTRMKALQLSREDFLNKITSMQLVSQYFHYNIDEYFFTLMKNILVIEFRNAIERALKNRYVYERRVGCVAILDTTKNAYRQRLDGDRNGLHQNDEDVVFFQMGEWVNGKWTTNEDVNINFIERLKLLNKNCIPKNLM